MKKVKLTIEEFEDIVAEEYLNIIRCTNCNGTGFNPYPNHDTAYPTCNICNGAGNIKELKTI